MKKPKRLHRIAGLFLLSTIMLQAHAQAPLRLTINELMAWTPVGPTASAANVSTVFLAGRKMLQLAQLHPGQSFMVRINYCPDGMNKWAGYLTEQNKFNMYNFTHWQYITHLTWFDGPVAIPSRPWIEAAHRNGVKIMGCIFFGDVNAFLAKDANGKYIGAQKLVDIAIYYGFDGWFFNEEAAVSSTTAAGLIALLKELQTIKPAGMEIHWYDAMIPSGQISYQNTLNSKNQKLFQDGTTRVSDAMFTNYWWGASHIDTMFATCGKLLRYPMEVYTGADLWPTRPNSPQKMFIDNNWLDLLYENDHLTHPRSSVGLFATNLTYNSGLTNFNNDPADYANFYKTEVRMFSGDDYDITTADSTGWKGFGYYWPVYTVISSLPFESSFNVGQGKIFSVNGNQVAKNWTDMSKQSILPSWQWAKTGTGTITAGYDFNLAYNGGTSVKLSGSLNNNSATLKLFLTKLALTSDSKFDLTYKAGTTGPSNLQVLFYFTDDLDNPAALDLGMAANTAWNTHTFDLSPYAGKELVNIGVKVASASSVSNYSMNLGAIKVYNNPLSATETDITPWASLQLYPALNTGSFGLNIHLVNEAKATILITDVLGRTVFQDKINGNTYLQKINLKDKGMYLVMLVTESKRLVRKVVVE